MVNTQLLNDKIKSSGLRAGFYKKATNGSEFTVKEVNIICDLLSITKLTDKESIFFAKEVN